MIDEREALQALLQLTLIFSGAVLALALLRPPLRRLLGVASPYTAWLLLPAALLALSLPEWPAQAPHVSSAVLETSQPAATPTRIEAPTPQAASLSPDLTRGLLLLWGLGLLATAAAFGWQQRRLQRSFAPAPGAWRSPAGNSPALVGCWPARLVLPLDFEQRFSPDEQRLVLAHEAVHAQRLDNHWNLLAATLLALQWFNPLAWWAWRRMRADQEIACDAAVLQRLGADAERARYAQALLKSCHDGPVALLSSRWGPQHPLLERLHLLRHPTPTRMAQRLRWPVFAGLGLGAALLVHAATPGLPQLPAAPKSGADGSARSELSTAPDSKSMGLQLELQRADARGDAPPAPPAPPPAAASAAMPAPPQPPAAPRPQAVLPAPPAAHPALPPAIVAPPPERAAPALPAVPAAGASAPIRVELALEFEERRGEHKQTLKTRPTLLLRPGGTGTIRLDVGDKPAPGSEAEQEQLEVSLNLRELDNEQVLIEAQLRLLKSGELIAKPRLVTKNGVKARIETGADKGPEGARFIRLDVLPTVQVGQTPPP